MRKIAAFLTCAWCLVLPPGVCGAAVSLTAELSERVESLLQSGQFAALDGMARSFKQQDARFPGGDPKLHTFYMALGAISDADCGCSHGQIPFSMKRQAVDKWLKSEPDSPAAHMAMALLWINYAWAARGGDYATSIAAPQWRAYHERLQTATGYIAGVDPKTNLFVLYERSLLAEATASPRETIMDAYNDLVRADPAWFPMYARQAEMLKEKWYGEQGELVHFAKALLHETNHDIGQAAYVEIATALVGGVKYDDGFEAVGDDWPALKRSYGVREKRYGSSENDAYALLQYAALFHDADTVAAALQQMRNYAERGYSLDMNNLGWTYLYGIGVPVQRDLAISWYRKGAADGNVTSEYQLGWILEQTQGGGAEALKWYKLADAHGYATAANNMGYMFENGEGVAQDYGRAANLYQSAAARGDHRAQFHLATLYARGMGVAKSENLAMQWMAKAAQGGDHDARVWLRDHAKKDTPQQDNTL